MAKKVYISDDEKALRAKIEKLENRKEQLKSQVIAGSLEATREYSICMQKIEVTNNRIDNLFATTNTAAIQPIPQALNIR